MEILANESVTVPPPGGHDGASTKTTPIIDLLSPSTGRSKVLFQQERSLLLLIEELLKLLYYH